ncbi:hypothetical protein ABEB36_002367 [Hypothenemus hampei]|uniref:Sex-determining region Y protein n=1 Tax=Hypothenemus hampei TaxID=57062 RepID=A0ABD1F649_HYPHA
MDYRRESEVEDILENISSKNLYTNMIKQKIPRPPNAFMLYANDHRKTLAHLYPAESNKEISKRLGQTWKDLNRLEKNKYFQKAKNIDQEHKRKYPGYVYNPRDARIRKVIRSTLRDKSVGASLMLPRRGSRKCLNSTDFHQNVLTSSIQPDGPMWNGNEQQTQRSCYNANESICNSNPFNLLPINITENTEEDQLLYEKEKFSLDAAERYNKLNEYEGFVKNNYLPISGTKFSMAPELCTNNTDYHREYIIKYFNHIPDYEIYNVTTEDGVSFPYVTIPNFGVGNTGTVSYV